MSVSIDNNQQLDSFTFHHAGGLDQNTGDTMNRYNDKIRFSGYDLVFINGNHYQGEQQILILDNEKESSVLKRIDQLQNIHIFTLKKAKSCSARLPDCQIAS